MARAFTWGTNRYGYTSGTPITDYPYTMACWFNSALADANGQRAMSIVNGTNTIGFSMYIRNSKVNHQVYDSGGNTIFATTANYWANAWHHGCVVGSSATDRAVYLNGANKNTSIVSRTPSGLAVARIGTFTTSSEFFNGRIAEAAIWNAALTDDEVAILAERYSPLLIRPENLVAYWPLIGQTDPEIELVNGYNLTLVGSPAAYPHPRVLYPISPWYVSQTAAGGSAPNAPSSLTATAVSSSQIDLAWTDNASDETGFELERSPNGTDSWAQVATPAANATSASDTGLSASTTYYYRIRAVNGFGNSAYSNTANDTTSAAATAVPVFMWHLRQQGIG